jgi:hypothetical protein
MPPTQTPDNPGLVEYALILVLVTIVIIMILSVLGPSIQNIACQIFPILCSAR